MKYSHLAVYYVIKDMMETDKQPGEEIIEQGPEGSREQELRSQWS